MEDFYLKAFEYGVLGFICCYLVLKGVPAMHALSVSITGLSEVIAKLQTQIEDISKRLAVIEAKLTSKS